MKVYPLDTINNLELELKLIYQYEKYNDKIELYRINQLDKTDIDYNTVKILYTSIHHILLRKKNILQNDKLIRYLNK